MSRFSPFSNSKNVVSITDYGAISGGDWQKNTTAFANALASSNAVFVPAGTYQVSQIILTGGKRLIGAGVNASIIQLSNDPLVSTKSSIGTQPGIIYIPNSDANWQSEITIEGIKIDGNWGKVTTSNIPNIAHGISTWDSGTNGNLNSLRVNLRDVHVYNTPGDGIHVGSHAAEYTVDNIHVSQTYGHGIYIPRMSDAIFTNLVISDCYKSGIWQGQASDGSITGGNNKYSDIKIYACNSGIVQGFWPTNYPAMITLGALASLSGMDIQQNWGDGLVLGGHMCTATGLLLDSNGTAYKTDSANLRIINGCMYSRLSGISSGNRFSSSGTGNVRTAYGIIIESGKIGYNKYDFTVDELEYVRGALTAYNEGYFMTPYSYTVNDPTSSLMINGREQFDVTSSVAVPSLAQGSSSYTNVPTLTGSNGSFTMTIPLSGENTSVTKNVHATFTVNSSSGTDNTTTANFYNTSLASAKYFLLWLRCKSDYPVQISVKCTNNYSGGNDNPDTTDIIIRNSNFSSAYRDFMVYVPVNTVSGATTSVLTDFSFTLGAGFIIQNRNYPLTIDNLKYYLVR